jgi:hypothetical protein
MIERPTPAGAVIAHAGAEVGEAASAAPVPQLSAAPEAESAAHVLAVSGPDPALAPPAPPKFADRPGPRFEPTVPRPSARRVPRASPGMESMKYRAVFACCMEATDTPTK